MAHLSLKMLMISSKVIVLIRSRYIDRTLREKMDLILTEVAVIGVQTHRIRLLRPEK